jgi:membrane protein
MKEVILSLRKVSLRWSIVIVFAATFIVGLFSLFNGKSLGLTAIITSLTITLFYVTFAVQAIEKDEKAVVTSCIFMAAMLCSIGGSFRIFNESPDFGNMLLGDVFGGNDSMQNWAYESVESSAPYTLLMNILMLVGFFISINNIKKKFVFAWWVAIIAQIVSTWGTFVVFSNSDFSTFQTCNNASSVITFVLLITVLCIGGKTKSNFTKNEVQYTKSEMPKPVSPETNSIVNKSEDLMKIKELLDSGILTEEEFNNEKKKILNM